TALVSDARGGALSPATSHPVVTATTRRNPNSRRKPTNVPPRVPQEPSAMPRRPAPLSIVRAMGERSGMSRRGVIIAAGSAAALVAIDGCSSGSSARGSNRSDTASGSVVTTTTTPPRQAGQRPDPTKAEGTDLIPQIEHIVVVMQENHSYDSYMGM